MTIIEPADRRFTAASSPLVETVPDLSNTTIKDLNELFLAYPDEGNIAILGESLQISQGIKNRLILSGVPSEKIIFTKQFNPMDDNWLMVIGGTEHINVLRSIKRDHIDDVLCIYIASDKSDKVNKNTADLTIFPNMTPEKIADALYAPLFEVLELRNPVAVSTPTRREEASETQLIIEMAKLHLASGKILLQSHIWNNYSLSDHFEGIINIYESDNFSEKTEWVRTPEEALEKLRQNPVGYYTAVFSENADFLGNLKKIESRIMQTIYINEQVL